MKDFFFGLDEAGFAKLVCGSDYPRVKIVRERGFRELFYDFQKVFGGGEIKLSLHPNFSAGSLEMVVFSNISLSKNQLLELRKIILKYRCSNFSIDTNLRGEIIVSCCIEGLYR